MPSVTSFTRPTSTAWWRSAAHFSAPWTGPSSMPSELGSLEGAHLNPAPFIPPGSGLSGAGRFTGLLLPSMKDPCVVPTRLQKLSWLLLRRCCLTEGRLPHPPSAPPPARSSELTQAQCSHQPTTDAPCRASWRQLTVTQAGTLSEGLFQLKYCICRFSLT